jgi:hypothetical protein
MKGYIAVEHTVWCGDCGNWERVSIGRKREASAVFRRLGWKRTLDRGWVCPQCLKPNVVQS